MGRTEKVGRGERDMPGDKSRGTKEGERMEGGSQMSMRMRERKKGNQERSESGGGGDRGESGGGRKGGGGWSGDQTGLRDHLTGDEKRRWWGPKWRRWADGEDECRRGPGGWRDKRETGGRWEEREREKKKTARQGLSTCGVTSAGAWRHRSAITWTEAAWAASPPPNIVDAIYSQMWLCLFIYFCFVFMAFPLSRLPSWREGQRATHHRRRKQLALLRKEAKICSMKIGNNSRDVPQICWVLI